MTISQAHQQLKLKLVNLYDDKEASNITNLILENICGLNKVERLINKNKEFTQTQQHLYNQYSAQLLKYTPVQYVLHEAWFAGLKLYVDENVLIPRPETEELVEWVIENSKSKELLETYNSNFTIMDIGTGSGCIAITLKNKLPNVKLVALDVDDKALKIAAENANTNKVKIDFLKANILKPINYENKIDIIVSNPPYIPVQEKNEMHANVVLYEPTIALFIPDEDPLLFYKAIIKFAVESLVNNGSLYFEIHENFEKEISDLLQSQNFTSIQIKKDLQGKSRMVKALFQLIKF